MGKEARGREARSWRLGGRIGLVFALVAICALWAAPARAADPYPAGDKPPQVLGTNFFNDEAPAATAGATESSVGATTTGSGLAFTGMSILILLVAALAALVLGFVLWRSARQRSAPSDL
jgi:hypothetical protein